MSDSGYLEMSDSAPCRGCFDRTDLLVRLLQLFLGVAVRLESQTSAPFFTSSGHRCTFLSAGATVSRTRSTSTSEQLLDHGARHSLEMRSPNFIRQFALLLVALSVRYWLTSFFTTRLIDGFRLSIRRCRLNGMPMMLSVIAARSSRRKVSCLPCGRGLPLVGFRYTRKRRAWCTAGMDDVVRNIPTLSSTSLVSAFTLGRCKTERGSCSRVSDPR